MAAQGKLGAALVTVPHARPSRLPERKFSHPRAEGIAMWACASMPLSMIQFAVRLEPLKNGGRGESL